MVRGIIKADDRHTIRRMRTAMQGNIIRALVELITNADDSYVRLENIPHKGVIEIVYKKEGYRGLFAVRDHAEGMSIEEVQEGFEKYGAATSGLKKGKRVRGYFGQGAKDALVSMVDGKICTVKNDMFVECRLFMENNKPWYDISDPIPASPQLRDNHVIEENGTVAYFTADRKVPRLDTVQEELANSYLLRKIMVDPHRKIYLIDDKSGKKRRLRYQMPEGREVFTEDFTIRHGKYGNFPVHISIWRADKELTQTGDDRHGGLVLLDDEDAILGISLFKFDNEPLAAHLFGEVTIGRFRELLEREEPVLREDRSGLETRHPFCEVLIPEIEKRIAKQVKAEKLRKQKENKTNIDVEERRRYRKAFTLLNEIAEVEAQSVTNLGQDPTDELEEPPNGFCLYPSSAQITVGKKYAFELRLNTNIVRHGSTIRVACANPKIHILTPQIKILREDGMGILRKYITVEGSEPNIDGFIRAIAGSNLSEAKVFVIPEKKGLLYEEGMEFQPGNLTLHPNQPRKIYLLAYAKMIPGGSSIQLSSDNESIHISKDKIIVNEADAIRHVAKYELEVWGEGIGQDAIITAESEPYMALLGVRIRSKKDTTEKSRKGMFNEPERNYDPDPLQRTSYSAETGKVIIYVNFPSVKHYLGDACQYIKTLPAQVFVADLLAERCFFEIAKRKVLSAGVTFRPEAIPDRIQRDSQELSRKYGKKVHEALVDQSLVNESRTSVGG